MDQIDLGQFPEVIEDIIRGYLTQEIEILELGKLGDLSFPNPDSKSEKDFDIKLPEFMETSVFSRNWKLIKESGTEKVLIICNPRKYLKNQRSSGEFYFYQVSSFIEDYLDSILKDNKIRCVECANDDLGTNIYIKISTVIEKFPDKNIRTERDTINFIKTADNYIDFLCEECFTENPKDEYKFLQKLKNKNIYISKNYYTLEDAYICMQEIRLNSKKYFPGYTETFIAFEDGTKFIQTSEDDFTKINTIKL